MAYSQMDGERPAKATHSVAWWHDFEHTWQFAGEGNKAFAEGRADYLKASGHKVRVRPL